MYKNFNEIESYVLSGKIVKQVVLAGSHDMDTLSAVVTASKKGILEPILIGDEENTSKILTELGEQPGSYHLIDEPDEVASAAIACKLVSEGKADIPMKGNIQTSTFMRAVLDKRLGFVPEGGLLSQATLLEYQRQDRMIVVSDCAVNISPDYNDKVRIIKNAVALAQKLGSIKPLVAVIAPLETVNPAIPSTIDAAMLSKAAERGQLGNCIVDGPLALDNAVSAEAAEHKQIKSSVAGFANVLIMPDVCAGNIFTKSLTFFAQLKSAGCLCGAACPVIMTSRSDTPENKYYAILTAILQSC